jgi:hypothetical protein
LTPLAGIVGEMLRLPSQHLADGWHLLTITIAVHLVKHGRVSRSELSVTVL